MNIQILCFADPLITHPRTKSTRRKLYDHLSAAVCAPEMHLLVGTAG